MRLNNDLFYKDIQVFQIYFVLSLSLFLSSYPYPNNSVLFLLPIYQTKIATVFRTYEIRRMEMSYI